MIAVEDCAKNICQCDGVTLRDGQLIIRAPTGPKPFVQFDGDKLAEAVYRNLKMAISNGDNLFSIIDFIEECGIEVDVPTVRVKSN